MTDCSPCSCIGFVLAIGYQFNHDESPHWNVKHSLCKFRNRYYKPLASCANDSERIDISIWRSIVEPLVYYHCKWSCISFRLGSSCSRAMQRFGRDNWRLLSLIFCRCLYRCPELPNAASFVSIIRRLAHLKAPKKSANTSPPSLWQYKHLFLLPHIVLRTETRWAWWR